MVILQKITWKEFERIVHIIKNYESVAIAHGEDKTAYDRILRRLTTVTKQPYNIDVEGLEKEELRAITVVVDMWNVINLQSVPYDDNCDIVSGKLQRAFFRIYGERVFQKS
jgi:hypothetical protein